MDPARPIDAGALLAECGWMRSLARRLIRDDELAEEIVQDTLVAALERRPASAGGMRAWLGVVTRNLALRARRRAAVRSSIERAAARREETSGGQEEVERMQLQRWLADAILALDEPCRSAVILRHLDGLSARQIAQRQGCTEAAARQRVARGLHELRARLDRRCGERGAWSALLARASALEPSAAGPALLTLGGIGMGTKAILGVAAGLAACALAAATLLPERARPERPRLAAEVESEKGASAAPSVLVEERAPAAPAPRDAASSRRGLPEASVQAAPARLAGSVSDRAGRAIVCAHARLARTSESDAEDALASATSDGDGRFELAWPDATAQSVWLVVEAEGFAPERRELRSAEPVSIVLARLPRVVGRVLDPDGRSTAPPGWVLAEIETSGAARIFSDGTELDADGRFELRDLPVGRLVRLSARAKGFAEGALEAGVQLELESLHRLDVSVTRGATVTGVVIDALTRAPVPGAAVWAESYDFDEASVSPTTHADAGGRFTLEGVAVDFDTFPEGGEFAHVYLLAEAEGYAAARTRGFGASRNDANVYEFEVTLDPAASSLSVRVLLPGGRDPAPRALFRSVDALGNMHISEVDEDGRFALDGLPQGTLAFTVRLKCAAGGVGEASLDGSIELAPGERRSVDLELEPPETLVEVRLIDDSGRGLPARELGCMSFFEANNLRMSLDGSTFTSDASGLVRIEGLAPGQYEFRPAPDEICADPPLQHVVLARGEHVSLGDFRVGTCLSLRGWVDRGRFDCSELELAVRRPDAPDWIESVSPASDGSFVFERLLAGTHELVLRQGERELDRALVDPRDAKAVTLSAR